MTAYELIAASIALAAISVPIVTWLVLWLIRRDRIFTNVAPGKIPADPDEAPTKYVSHGAQYWGEVEARSTPPAGVSPGLGGVVVDGSADGRDIAAMILDLARRGWLQLRQVSGTGSAGGDWAITRVDQPLDATLDLNELHLVTNLATPGGTAWLSELCGASDDRFSLVQLDLHREVVSRGWYPAAPNQTSDIPMAVLGLGGLLGFVIALIDVSAVSVGAGAVIIACAYLTSVIVRGGTPRTALGTAVRIQALGLRRYIDEARTYQFSYTDALDTFRTYLPWAVVFELENQWAEVFAELDVVAQTSELHFARDLGWFANIRDSERATPPTVPVGESTAPRRGAYSEEDVVTTVLMSADEVAAEKQSAVAKVTIARVSPETSVDAAQSVSTPETPGSHGVRDIAASRTTTIVPAVHRAASAIAGLWRRSRPDSAEDTHRILPVPPAPDEQLTTVTTPDTAAESALEVAPTVPIPETPTTVEVASATDPVATPAGGISAVTEKIPGVRQWVPRESSRPGALQPRRRPAAAPAPVPSVAAAPVTPLRVPAAAEAPATPARAPETPVTPARATEGPATPPREEEAAVVAPPVTAEVATTVREARSEATMFSDWMSEFDLAMTGDVEDKDLEATDGGTVITGPERFDVLLTPPLWPDVPLGERAGRAASADLPQ